MTEQSEIHPFERNGLGKAPYRFLYVTENMYVCPGVCKPGGCCDYCLTGIRWEYWFESADGRRFRVGCDCAERASADLGRVCRRARRDYDREARAAARREESRKARESRRATFERERAHRRAWVLGLALAADAYQNSLLRSLAFDAWQRGLSDNQAALAFRIALTERANRERRADHVGTVGKRGEFRVAVERVHWLAGGFYVAGRTVESALVFLRDLDTGALLVWKTANPTIDDDFRGTVRATVKEHGEYRGIPQTAITRVKAI